MKSLCDVPEKSDAEEKDVKKPQRRASDRFVCEADPGPCDIACGSCLLCRCHQRFNPCKFLAAT